MNKDRSHGRVTHLINPANKLSKKKKKYSKIDRKHTLLIIDYNLEDYYENK